MIFEHAHYPSFLKACLAEKKSRNPAFSLRAFAKQLGLAPSTLSEVIKGGQNFSPAMALQVADRLELAPDESEYFCLLVAQAAARDPALQISLQTRLQAVFPTPTRPQDLGVDFFRMISDWYHLAILELSRLEGFELTEASAAQRLGISPFEAAAAIERLERLELLKRDARGRLKKEQNFWVVQAKVPNAALRQYHRQMLEMAISSLDSQSPQEKFVGSETFGIDPAQLPEATAKLDRFLREMTELSARARHRTEVYHLGAQFFRVTKPSPENPARKGSKK